MEVDGRRLAVNFARPRPPIDQSRAATMRYGSTFGAPSFGGSSSFGGGSSYGGGSSSGGNGATI